MLQAKEKKQPLNRWRESWRTGEPAALCLTSDSGALPLGVTPKAPPGRPGLLLWAGSWAGRFHLRRDLAGAPSGAVNQPALPSSARMRPAPPAPSIRPSRPSPRAAPCLPAAGRGGGVGRPRSPGDPCCVSMCDQGPGNTPQPSPTRSTVVGPGRFSADLAPSCANGSILPRFVGPPALSSQKGWGRLVTSKAIKTRILLFVCLSMHLSTYLLIICLPTYLSIC